MKPVFQLSPKASDIFVAMYLLATLFLRFVLEAQLGGRVLPSLGLGAFALLFLWALWKSGYLQPTWFGLMGSRKVPQQGRQ
ncbi:MAG: hypothetical protein AAFV80_07705 [Bacteroidota bacterium]